jgi:hypothetical protein
MIIILIVDKKFIILIEINNKGVNLSIGLYLLL